MKQWIIPQIRDAYDQTLKLPSFVCPWFVVRAVQRACGAQQTTLGLVRLMAMTNEFLDRDRPDGGPNTASLEVCGRGKTSCSCWTRKQHIGPPQQKWVWIRVEFPTNRLVTFGETISYSGGTKHETSWLFVVLVGRAGGKQIDERFSPMYVLLVQFHIFTLTRNSRPLSSHCVLVALGASSRSEVIGMSDSPRDSRPPRMISEAKM